MLEEIAEADHVKDDANDSSKQVDGPGDIPIRPRLNRTNTMRSKRKSSMTSMTGITENLSEYLHEHGAADFGARLVALEESTHRIEDMLGKLCADMGENDSASEAGAKASRTATKYTDDEEES